MGIIDWLDSNKEWVFSGIGVFLISALIIYFTKRSSTKKQVQKSGNNSTNIQVGDNLIVHTKESNNEPDKKE